MNENDYELAKSGYEAYSKTTDNKNFRGEEMPKFDGLPEKIKEAWIAATKQIELTVGENHQHRINSLTSAIDVAAYELATKQFSEAFHTLSNEIELTDAKHLKPDFTKDETEYIAINVNSDDDGHEFIIPNELLIPFDSAREKAADTGNFDDLEDFEKYMTGGDVNLYQLYIAKNGLEDLIKKR